MKVQIGPFHVFEYMIKSGVIYLFYHLSMWAIFNLHDKLSHKI